MATECKFTGRKRYRVLKRLFRKPVLILQLEIEGVIPNYDLADNTDATSTWWVDASPEAMMTFSCEENSGELKGREL